MAVVGDHVKVQGKMNSYRKEETTEDISGIQRCPPSQMHVVPSFQHATMLVGTPTPGAPEVPAHHGIGFNAWNLNQGPGLCISPWSRATTHEDLCPVIELTLSGRHSAADDQGA